MKETLISSSIENYFQKTKEQGFTERDYLFNVLGMYRADLAFLLRNTKDEEIKKYIQGRIIEMRTLVNLLGSN